MAGTSGEMLHMFADGLSLNDKNRISANNEICIVM